MEIKYRKVNTQDLSEVRFIAEMDVAVPALFDTDFCTDESVVINRIDYFLKGVKERDFFEVATINNKVVGFHLLTVTTHHKGLMAAAVNTLWVAPQYRKIGIASALKRRGEEWARDMKLDHIHTMVSNQNTAMILMNEKMGYKLTSYRFKKKL